MPCMLSKVRLCKLTASPPDTGSSRLTILLLPRFIAAFMANTPFNAMKPPILAGIRVVRSPIPEPSASVPSLR